MTIRKKIVAVAAASIALLVALSPTACYLSRGAWEEGKILARRQPIKELVASRHTDPLVRRKLAIVLEARQYAKDSIHLKTEESFTTYSKLDRDTLVMVLSAAFRDKLEPYTWWFPIVGRVPYKGFFDFDEAQRTAKKMFDDGYDVQVRPSPAFSTLGWFNDPLNSATLREDTLDLVNTVIHEVTHNTFYAPGKAVFNESFANFVGARGAAQFFRSRGQPEAAARIDAQWADDKVLGDFWTSLARSLDSAYAEHPGSKAARIEARDTVYARARRTLVSDIGPQLSTVSPFYVQRVPLNNAALLARRVYAKDLDLFDQVYAREGQNLRGTIGRVIALAKSDKKDPYAAIRRWLGLPPEKRPPAQR